MIPLRSRRKSNVYFLKPVGFDGPIKIGCSGSPVSRLETLAAWSPWPLELIGSVPASEDDERFLHSCFADLHSHREWFRSSPELRGVIAEILAAGHVDAVKHRLSPKGRIRKPPTWSAERRRYSSYAGRIRNVSRRLRAERGDGGAWDTPPDVSAIILAWGKRRNAEAPAADDMARLDQFLADPNSQSVESEWFKRKAQKSAELERQSA